MQRNLVEKVYPIRTDNQQQRAQHPQTKHSGLLLWLLLSRNPLYGFYRDVVLLEDDDPLDFFRDDPKLSQEESLAESRVTLDEIADLVAKESSNERIASKDEEIQKATLSQNEANGIRTTENRACSPDDLSALAKVWH